MKQPTPQERARRWNPIIGDTPTDTLHNAACVASFLARLQSDLADGRPDPFSSQETRGLHVLTDTLAAALWFEVEGCNGQPADEGSPA